MKKVCDSAREGLAEIYSASEASPEPENGFYFNPEAGESGDSAPEADPASFSALENSMAKKSSKKKRSFFKKLVLFLLFAGLLFVSYLLWRAYNNLTAIGSQTPQDVALEIIGPKEVTSGEINNYRIIFANKSSAVYKNIEINLRLPSGFFPGEFNPAPKNQAAASDEATKLAQYFWEIPELSPLSKEEINLSGLIIGEIGARLPITASVHYEPVNFSSDFRATNVFAVAIKDTAVALEINAPVEVVNNSEIKYQIKIRPAKEIFSASTSDLFLYLDFPVGFSLANVETELEPYSAATSSEINQVWLVKDLNQEYLLSATGTLSSDSENSKEIIARVGYNINGQFKLQTSAQALTKIIKPVLNLDLQANGLKIESLAANWNEEINYNLTGTNEGEVVLSDIILKLNFTGADIFNWQSLNCEDQAVCDFLLTSSENGVAKTLYWTREQLSDLVRLDPGDSRLLKFKLTLKEKPSGDSDENLHNLIQAEADFKVADISSSKEIKSNPVDIKIKTQAKLSAEARYYTDDNLKIGSGPLPPLVGVPTSFRIFWEVANVTNALKNIQIRTALPKNVNWTDKTQAFVGGLSYNSYNRQITWTINELKANPNEPARANFEISVTPAIGQIGQYLTLTEETTLDALDIFTLENIQAISGYLTSELENDLYAEGKGRVE